MTIDVSEDRLASLLIMRRDLEEYPEPYRGHGENELVIKFSTYKRFIDKYLEIRDYLSMDTLKLKSWLHMKNDKLLIRSFYRDVALAVAKEVWFTEGDHKPTKITHVIDGADEMPDVFVNTVWETFPDALRSVDRRFLKYLKDLNYSMSPSKVVTYRQELDYATVLYAMSLTDSDVPYLPWSLARE